MTELGIESQPSLQVDRVADKAAPAIPWRAEPLNWLNVPQAQNDVGAVKLPTLHLRDDVTDSQGKVHLRTNINDSYSVNSDIAQLYIKNRPAVVRITTLETKADKAVNTSSGSGSIIDSSGIIVTGYHVVQNAATLQVVMSDGKRYNATILATDVAKDEALIQIKTNNPFAHFSTVKLASDSQQAQATEKLVAFGFPKNQDAMHISMLDTEKRVPLSKLNIQGGLILGEDKERVLIRAGGPVDHGNSGGPVFDRKTGEQIGIVNLSDPAAGTAYITPMEDLQQFLAATKARYNIKSLPAQAQTRVQQSSFQPALIPGTFNPGTGLGNLERFLSGIRP